MASHVFGTSQTSADRLRRSSEAQQRKTTDSKTLSCAREPGLASSTCRRLAEVIAPRSNHEPCSTARHELQPHVKRCRTTSYSIFCEAFLDRNSSRPSSQVVGKKISLRVALFGRFVSPSRGESEVEFLSLPALLACSLAVRPIPSSFGGSPCTYCAMLGSTAICSAVSLVGSFAGFVASPSPLKLDRRQPAGFAAEDLSRMTGRKRTIARLPQAPAVTRKWASLTCEACWLRIRIGSGQAGGYPVSQVSL